MQRIELLKRVAHGARLYLSLTPWGAPVQGALLQDECAPNGHRLIPARRSSACCAPACCAAAAWPTRTARPTRPDPGRLRDRVRPAPGRLHAARGQWRRRRQPAPPATPASLPGDTDGRPCPATPSPSSPSSTSGTAASWPTRPSCADAGTATRRRPARGAAQRDPSLRRRVPYRRHAYRGPAAHRPAPAYQQLRQRGRRRAGRARAHPVDGTGAGLRWRPPGAGKQGRRDRGTPRSLCPAHAALARAGHGAGAQRNRRRAGRCQPSPPSAPTTSSWAGGLRWARTSTRLRELVPKLVQTCRTLGVGVIAEAVETVDEYHWLRNAGVEQFRGNLFAPPTFEAVPPAQLP